MPCSAFTTHALCCLCIWGMYDVPLIMKKCVLILNACHYKAYNVLKDLTGREWETHASAMEELFCSLG